MRFVNVTWDLFWDRIQIDYDAWDTHTQNFADPARQQAAGSRPDLHGAAGGPGRARPAGRDAGGGDERDGPHAARSTRNGGRDHWTYCYSVLFAGAGIRGGTVYGASDAQAAYVKDGRSARRTSARRSTSAWASTRR